MIKTLRAAEPRTIRPVSDAAGIFLTPNGRLPGFAQRRLDDLLAKQRSERLTQKEQRELTEALDYIDAKTIEMLEYGLPVARPAGGKTRARPVTGSRTPTARRSGHRHGKA